MDPSIRIPLEPPLIPPLPDCLHKEERPLWSVMVPAYNCSQYLSETLESVLQQDPGKDKMQIEVCDDASTDADVEKMVYEIGDGRVNYFRQPVNAGSLRNFETCLNRSRGRLIHLLHGDDKVKRGFYDKMENLFLTFPDIGAAFCRYISVDQFDGREIVSDKERSEAGVLENWLERLARKQRIQTPAMVVKRSVYEKLGAFYGIHYGEDWEMWLRIAANYKVGYIPEILAEYRKRTDSISGQYILTGQNIQDLKKVMYVSRQYFSAEKWKDIREEAYNHYAWFAINTARKIWKRSHDNMGTKMQIKEALSLSSNYKIVYQAFKLYFKMFLNIKR